MSLLSQILGSIVVSIPACHAGDRGSIPRRGELAISFCLSFDMGWFGDERVKHKNIAYACNCA